MRHEYQKIYVDEKTGKVRVVSVPHGESMTQPQFAEECDINNIMKKYSSTGQFQHVTSKQGRYGDFSMITDYQDMLHTVQYAQEAFATLPAEVRARFRNDPGQLLDFIQDEKNYDEAVKLGLCEPRKMADKLVNSDDLNDVKKTKTPPSEKAPVKPDASE